MMVNQRSSFVRYAISFFSDGLFNVSTADMGQSLWGGTPGTLSFDLLIFKKQLKIVLFRTAFGYAFNSLDFHVSIYFILSLL